MNDMSLQIDQDRAEIIRAVEEETNAWLRRDLDGWAACWVHADYVRRIGARTLSGASMADGFATIHNHVDLNIRDNPEPPMDQADLVRDNYTVRIGRDMAWVTYHQTAPWTDNANDTSTVPGLNYEMRVLEKHKGRWLISCFVDVQTRLGYYTCPWVRIEPDGTIVDMNKAARSLLRHHRALRVTGARLTGRTRNCSTLLREAVEISGKRAARHSDCNVRRNAYPLIFADTDDGQMSLCWVSTFDHMLVLLFDDDDQLDSTLQRAAALYGLTEQQRRVATGIAQGEDLPQVATQLGIQANTARTHVKRMFEKVGVNSQPALMRALLSVEAPGV